MNKAISLHLGLNSVDPAHYGFTGALRGCINDAKKMRDLAAKQRFQPTLLLDDKATSHAALKFLDDAARDLTSGDTLLITYAGHGFELPDLNNDEQSGATDQTWALFDRMVVDDELSEKWDRFEEGVRIIIVSDSCHSETIARSLEFASSIASASRDRFAAARAAGVPGLLIGEKVRGGRSVPGYRLLPRNIAAHVTRNHHDFYASIQQQTRGSERVNPQLRATVLTLAACRDWQTAADGDPHGLYTQALLSVWNDGAFEGTYLEFQEAIAHFVGSAQSPQFRRQGRVNPSFEQERPFTTLMRDTDARPGSQPKARPETGRESDSDYVPDSDDEYVRLELSIARQSLARLTEEQVAEFLRTEGADTVSAVMAGVRSLGDSSDAEVRVARNGSIRCVATIGPNGAS
ncbi:MAG TPA: caspase family protein [Thermoanaerobaculia bacterium]|nr:caspase family protein [Thermoanaerobaculia bacterium]